MAAHPTHRCPTHSCPRPTDRPTDRPKPKPTQGVDLSKPNELGWTAWQYAKRHGHSAVCEALESAGATPSTVPELSQIERHGAKLFKVVRRSVIREAREVRASNNE
eukprot:SAG11_NODE_14766_length_600_cov_1.233533_1_plen_106_part_00